jgi:transposase InsO family protein
VSGRTVAIEPGAMVLFEATSARVVEFDGHAVTLQFGDGGYRSVALTHFAARARSLHEVEADGADPGLVLAGLTAGQRERMAARAGHVREVLTGYAAGHIGAARPGEPRAPYAPGTALLARYAAKAAELGVTARTVQNWVAAYRQAGEAGLADQRHQRPRRTGVDARWQAAVRSEIAAGVNASTPTRAALLARAAARLKREYGAGVVPLPSRAAAYRQLAELAKGTNAVTGSAKGRRSIAGRPAGVYGRLRATRPGEYLILDTQDLDVFAMEPITGRWVRAQLTVAQDLFDRQIVGLKVTPVSTKAVDVAGVLFEAVTGRAPGRAELGPLHGVPEHLVFTETRTDQDIWCPPETLVVDHGKAFLSAHVIGVCARLGISIQPAQPYKATDKPTVERFFKSLRERLIENLPGYKGPDLHSRGEGMEEQAFLFLHELEDAVRDWIAIDYHAGKQDGLAVAQWPNLALSPNEMHAAGVAKAGQLRLAAAPELVFEFFAVRWRTIQHYGVEVDGLRYNGSALDRHRNRRSPYGGQYAGKWPIRVNPDDVRAAYLQDPGDAAWHALAWEHAWMLDAPFSAEAARHARTLAARSGRFPDPAAALGEVLERWSSGAVADRRERRIAVRLAAERAGLPPAPIGAEPEPGLGAAAMFPQQAAPGMIGDDDAEEELIEDVEAFYRDALEVLE